MLKKIRNFLENTSGSILPTMGVLSIPLAVAAGAALDYTRYVNMRNDVQTAIDAAGIATTKELQENILLNVPSNLTGNARTAYIQNEIDTYADNFLKANITSDLAKGSYTFNATYTPSSLSNNENTLHIVADITYDTIFSGVVGYNSRNLLVTDKINDQIESIINTANRTVEIALVMDNSGSMALEAGNLNPGNNPAPVADRRLTVLKNASKKLVSDLFKAGKDSALPKPVQFSIVPFSTTVNVGNQQHVNHYNGNKFLDIRGFASYHNENLDWKNTYRLKPGERIDLWADKRAANLRKADGSRQYMTRLQVFKMLGTEWEGCVEMRPYPHNIQDTYFSNNTYHSKNSEKLFVPYFVPDGPDYRYFQNYSNFWQQINYTWDTPPNNTSRFYSSDYIRDFYDYDPDSELAFPRFRDDDQFGVSLGTNDIDANQINRSNWVSKYQAYQGLDQNKIDALPNSPLKSKQLKNILNDLELPSFTKNLSATNSSYFADSGPNAFCPDIPIQQLTQNKNKINNTIDSMEAHGGTNIQIGLTWGWRTLSKAKPFHGGRDITDPDNRKILILLTDGNNQMLPENLLTGDYRNTRNKTAYTAWGYQRTPNVLKHATTGANTHGRLLAGTNDTANTIYASGGFPLDTTPDDRAEYEDLMNLHTNQACNNIKDDGITIYTIAFDVSGSGKVKDLLENCAGSGRIDNKEIVTGLNFYHDAVGLSLDDTFQEIAASISAIRIAQ